MKRIELHDRGHEVPAFTALHFANDHLVTFSDFTYVSGQFPTIVARNRQLHWAPGSPVYEVPEILLLNPMNEDANPRISIYNAAIKYLTDFVKDHRERSDECIALSDHTDIGALVSTSSSFPG